MKINPINAENENTLVSHMIMHCMSKSFNSMELGEIADRNRENNGIEVQLLIEGKEVDIKDFCDHWQSQVKRMIKEEAHEMIEARLDFSEVEDMMGDLQNRIKKEIDKRLEDWEK